MAIPVYTGGGHLYADAPRQPAVQIVEGMNTRMLPAGLGAQVETRLYMVKGMVLSIGSEGTAVRQLQQDLQDLGFPPGPIDGVYGPQTADAVETFQRAGPNITIDGVVGSETKAKLRDYMQSMYNVDLRAPQDNGNGSPPERDDALRASAGMSGLTTALLAAGVGLGTLYVIQRLR